MIKITLIHLAMHEKLAGKNQYLYIRAPHSLLTVASLMKGAKHPRVNELEFEILDENIQVIDFNSLISDYVGFSVTTVMAPRVYEIAKQLRARGIKVILGGVHVSVCTDEAAAHCDVLVTGELENTVEDLVEDLLNQLPKRIYKNSEFPELKNQPILDFSILNLNNYGMVGISTTRGCPFSCEFCSVDLMYGRKIRTRNIEDVIKEVIQIKDKLISFEDDNFIADRKHAIALMKSLIPLNIKWVGQASINIGKDIELLELLKESGCQFLFIGMETVNPKNFEKMGKPQNQVHEYYELINNLHKYEVDAYGSFVVGFDYDEMSAFEDLENFIETALLREFNLQILKPFPGTRLRARLKEEGRLKSENDWENFQEFNIDFIPKHMTPELLVEKFIQFHQKMSTPKSIFKRVRLAPHREITHAANMGFKYKLQLLDF